jgi:hypothetical protein
VAGPEWLCCYTSSSTLSAICPPSTVIPTRATAAVKRVDQRLYELSKFLEVLLPCAEDLERVAIDHHGDADVETSQINDISLYKYVLVRKHTSEFSQDSSEEG